MERKKVKQKLLSGCSILVLLVIAGNIWVAQQISEPPNKNQSRFTSENDSAGINYIPASVYSEKVNEVIWTNTIFTSAFITILILFTFGYFDPLINKVSEDAAKTKQMNHELNKSKNDLRQALAKLVFMNRKLLDMQRELKGKSKKLQQSEQEIIHLSEDHLKTSQMLLKTQEMLLEN